MSCNIELHFVSTATTVIVSRKRCSIVSSATDDPTLIIFIISVVWIDCFVIFILYTSFSLLLVLKCFKGQRMLCAVQYYFLREP